MPKDEDDTNEIEGKCRPEAGGIIDIATNSEQGDPDPEPVFNKEVVKLH